MVGQGPPYESSARRAAGLDDSVRASSAEDLQKLSETVASAKLMVGQGPPYATRECRDQARALQRLGENDPRRRGCG